MPDVDHIDEHRVLIAGQILYDRLRSAALRLRLRKTLVATFVSQFNGWVVELATLPNDVTIALSLDHSLRLSHRNLWFGFWSNEKGKLRYLETALPSDLRPALQIGDGYKWLGDLTLLDKAIIELYDKEEDGSGYLGRYLILSKEGDDLEARCEDGFRFLSTVARVATAPPELKVGAVIDNDALRKIFAVGNMGGMRRSHLKNLLIIVSDHTKALYIDRWEDDILHYTGMGKSGEQGLTDHNKTLSQSQTNGVAVHLFEVFKQNQYIYQGPVELAGAPYQEEQNDTQGDPRVVWMFPIRRKTRGVEPPPLKRMLELQVAKERALAGKSLASLKAMAKRAKQMPPRRAAITEQFIRDPYVAAYVKKAAAGICNLCEEKAPFEKGGEPFFHCHHVVWLARGGPDTIQNTVAICPNCHERMHQLDRSSDIRKLSAHVKARDPDLKSLDHVALSLKARSTSK